MAPNTLYAGEIHRKSICGPNDNRAPFRFNCGSVGSRLRGPPSRILETRSLHFLREDVSGVIMEDVIVHRGIRIINEVASITIQVQFCHRMRS